MTTYREFQNMLARGYPYVVVLQIPLDDIGGNFKSVVNQLINDNRPYLRKMVREYLHFKYKDYKGLVFKHTYVKFPYKKNTPFENAVTCIYCRDLETAAILRLVSTNSHICLVEEEIKKLQQKA